MRRRPYALCCYALALAQAFLGVGCQDTIDGGGSRASSVAGVLAAQDLGQVAFGIYRGSVAAEPTGASRDARLAALDAHRQPFVDAVNDIANVRTLSGVGQTIEALFALVDDGTLPTLAETTAQFLEQLAADPQATDALARLFATPHAMPTGEGLRLLGRMFDYPQSEDLWRAVAALIEENDGVDDQGQPNGEPDLVADLLALIHGALTRFAGAPQPNARLAQAFDGVIDGLTDEATLRGRVDFGAPEWVVRVDDRGLARVATDPATGLLQPPFVDGDGDGLADVDARNAFVDAAGAPIDAPTFGDPASPGFDAAGRAIAPGGALLFEYVDAKRTHLALLLHVLGELLARDAHLDARTLLEAALGPVNASGTYDADGPVADLLWGVLALFDPEVGPEAVRTTVALLQQDPDGFERFLVGVSRAVDAATRGGASGRRLSDPATVQLFDDLLPLADDLFEQPTNGPSTARVMLGTLADLGQTAPDMPFQLAPLFRYRTVAREGTPDGDRNSVDEAASSPVDRTQPAWVGSWDNRSAVQQLLDLLARADGCSFFGNNLAVVVLDAMAGLSPSTVNSLVSIVTALPGFLTGLVCPGISQDLASLDSLASSGALDAFLPLARAFKDRGETELLVRLLVRLQRDYDPVIRPLEEDLARMLDSGAPEAFLDVLDVARRVNDPVTGRPAIDVAASALETLVDDDAVVAGPRGTTALTRLHLLLRPLQQLDARLVAAGRTAELGRLVDSASAVLLGRVVVGGREQLRNGSVIPLLERVFEGLAQVLPQDPAVRSADVADAQAAVAALVGDAGLVTVLTLLRTIAGSPAHALIDQGLVDLLTPQPNVADDIFGGVVRVWVIFLQRPPALAILRDLAPAAAAVFDPGNPAVPDGLKAFQRLLSADQGQTVLNLLRAAFNPAPGELLTPAEQLLETFQAVEAARQSAAGAPLDGPGVASLLDRAVAFIRDPDGGLERVFIWVRSR